MKTCIFDVSVFNHVVSAKMSQFMSLLVGERAQKVTHKQGKGVGAIEVIEQADLCWIAGGIDVPVNPDEGYEPQSAEGTIVVED